MTNRCEHYAHVARADDRFCSKCGAPLPSVESETATVAPDAEDSSWVHLAGEPAAVSPAAFVAPPLVDPQPAPEPAAPLPPPAEQPATSQDDLPSAPRRHTSGSKGLLIAVVAAGIAGALALVVWTMGWTGGADDRAEIAAEADDPASPDEEWQTGYQDIFLSQDEVSLVTSAEARQRDYPTTEGTTVQRTLPANTSVSGRWVRGRDPTTKWLKLAGGGYIWEGNLAQPGGEGSPIEISLNNRRANFGPEIEVYLDRAKAQQRAYYDRIERLPEKEQAAALSDIEAASVWVPIPSRRWRGLTITSAAMHYESHGITFREDVATVRRVLTAVGVRVDNDGTIPLSEEEAISCGISDTAGFPEGSRYGATSLICGV